jgi:hypothetical protein
MRGHLRAAVSDPEGGAQSNTQQHAAEDVFDEFFQQAIPRRTMERTRRPLHVRFVHARGTPSAGRAGTRIAPVPGPFSPSAS